MTPDEAIAAAVATGRCPRQHYSFTADMARLVQAKTALAVGVHHGGSGLLLAALAQTDCVDPWAEDADYNTFLANVDGLTPGIHRVPSVEFFAQNQQRYDIAFIDGDHSYDGFKADLEAAIKCCRLIICHPRPKSAKSPDPLAATRAISDLQLSGVLSGHYVYDLFVTVPDLPPAG